MSKGRVMAVLCALLILLTLPVARADTEHLALIYSLGELEENEANVRAVAETLMYMGKSVDFLPADSVSGLSDYSSVILCLNEDTPVSANLTAKLKGYAGQILIIGQGGADALVDPKHLTLAEGNIAIYNELENGSSYNLPIRRDTLRVLRNAEEVIGGVVYAGEAEYPFCARVGNITFMAYFDGNDAWMRENIATVIAQWLWIYENLPNRYNAYLVLDQVYPFCDLERLMEMIDVMTEANVPYCISVMPIYINGDYPAMQRFCEILTYAQSCGADIILRSPMVSMEYTEVADIKAHIATAMDIYVRYGVYPVAIEAPDYYLFTEEGLEVLSGFRSVFLFDTDYEKWSGALKSNIAWRDGHRIVCSAYSKQHDSSAYARAIYLDMTQDVEALEKQILRIKNSKIALGTLRQADNSVYMGHNHVATENGEYFINGHMVSLNYKPFVYEEEVHFDRGLIAYLTNQIEASNKYIMVFVGASCSIYVVCMFVVRRVVRRQVLHAPLHKKKKS